MITVVRYYFLSLVLTSLFAVALLALPAFAGTATYVGSHTAGDVRLTECPECFGNMVVNYDGANISFSADGGTSFIAFTDEAGEWISFGRGDYVFTMVIESATLPDYNVTPVMFGVMTMAEPPFGQWAYVANDAGADLIVGSTQNFLEWTITPPSDRVAGDIPCDADDRAFGHDDDDIGRRCRQGCSRPGHEYSRPAGRFYGSPDIFL
jgi:hypothetical protein